MRKFVMAAAMLGIAHGAQAADMPDFAPLRGAIVDAPSRLVNWQGYYVGGQASYASTVSNLASTTNNDLHPVYPVQLGAYNWPGLASPHANSSGFGGFAGYNSQWDDVVVGLEANYIHGRYNPIASNTGLSVDRNGIPLTTTSSASVRIDDFGSVRARAGYAVNNFLPYLFAGFGVGNMTVDRMTTATPGPASPATLTTTATKSNLVYGYSVGAGVDIMMMAGLFLRAEYEYQRVTAKDIDSNVNSARLGVGYKF